MNGKARIRLFATIIILLSTFGIYKGAHAAIVAAQGGTHEFGGIMDYPLWAIAHFAGAVVFMMLMPLQLWEGFRNRHRTLHRRTGRLLFGAGLVISLSALPLPYVMPSRPVSEKVFMTVFALVFPYFLIKAVVAARNNDFAGHRDWMTRAVSVALGPLVQRLILPLFIVALGVHSLSEFWEFFVTSAWLSSGVTLSTAEWWIHQRRAHGFAAAPVSQANATRVWDTSAATRI